MKKFVIGFMAVLCITIGLISIIIQSDTKSPIVAVICTLSAQFVLKPAFIWWTNYFKNKLN